MESALSVRPFLHSWSELILACSMNVGNGWTYLWFSCHFETAGTSAQADLAPLSPFLNPPSIFTMPGRGAKVGRPAGYRKERRKEGGRENPNIILYASSSSSHFSDALSISSHIATGVGCSWPGRERCHALFKKEQKTPI